MPAWLILSALSKLPWRWIGLGLAVLALVLFIDHRGYNRGKAHMVAKYQPVLDRALTNMRTLQSNQRILTSAIDRQNAAVVALKVDGDKRVADGKTALAQAQRANAGLSETAAALRKSAGSLRTADPACKVSDALAKVGSI